MRELFLQGKATNVEMLDAETEVIRAKLRKLDAQISLLVNQIKYDHADRQRRRARRKTVDSVERRER